MNKLLRKRVIISYCFVFFYCSVQTVFFAKGKERKENSTANLIAKKEEGLLLSPKCREDGIKVTAAHSVVLRRKNSKVSKKQKKNLYSKTRRKACLSFLKTCINRKILKNYAYQKSPRIPEYIHKKFYRICRNAKLLSSKSQRKKERRIREETKNNRRKTSRVFVMKQKDQYFFLIEKKKLLKYITKALEKYSPRILVLIQEEKNLYNKKAISSINSKERLYKQYKKAFADYGYRITVISSVNKKRNLYKYFFYIAKNPREIEKLLSTVKSLKIDYLLLGSLVAYPDSLEIFDKKKNNTLFIRSELALWDLRKTAKLRESWSEAHRLELGKTQYSSSRSFLLNHKSLFLLDEKLREEESYLYKIITLLRRSK